MTLKLRITRLEDALNDEFLGIVDDDLKTDEERAAAKAVAKKEAHERWEKALAALASTMSKEHYAHVANELHKMNKLDVANPEVSNLTRQFIYMAELMADDLARPEKERRPWALPPEVAEVYLTYPEAVALANCNTCHCYLPLLPGRNLSELHMWERNFFPKCPLCDAAGRGGSRGGQTSYCSWPSPTYVHREVARIRKLREQAGAENDADVNQ